MKAEKCTSALDTALVDLSWCNLSRKLEMLGNFDFIKVAAASETDVTTFFGSLPSTSELERRRIKNKTIEPWQV